MGLLGRGRDPFAGLRCVSRGIVFRSDDMEVVCDHIAFTFVGGRRPLRHMERIYHGVAPVGDGTATGSVWAIAEAYEPTPLGVLNASFREIAPGEARMLLEGWAADDDEALDALMRIGWIDGAARRPGKGKR